MAILAFQQPDNVIMLEGADEYTARFEFKPLEPGYGTTIGNALRRILLSSIEGFAIASIRIDGVDHEFATIPGVVESVTDIILNLKQIRFKQIVPGVDEEVITLSVAKKEVFTAGDLNQYLNSFEVVNPDLEICHLSKNTSFQIEIRINKGRGYVVSDENRRPAEDVVNTIPIDSIYTPIRKVMYDTENFRVEQKTDYEKLIIEVQTDGTITPKLALQEAANILIEHFKLFASESALRVEVSAGGEMEFMDEQTLKQRNLLMTSVEDSNLSVRAKNCLISNNVQTLADLVSRSKQELLKFRNFGKKTLEELEEFLQEEGLEFDLDLKKFNLE